MTGRWWAGGVAVLALPMIGLGLAGASLARAPPGGMLAPTVVPGGGLRLPARSRGRVGARRCAGQHARRLQRRGLRRPAIRRRAALPTDPGVRVEILALEPSFTATAGTVPASSAANAAIGFAEAAVGIPYRWGGNGSAGSGGQFGCSGLTQAAYALSGIALPHNAAAQWYSGVHVPTEQLQPGDLVFFATNLSNPDTIHHVGIYIGGGQMIDAPHTGADVRVEPYNWPDYIGAVRPHP